MRAHILIELVFLVFVWAIGVLDSLALVALGRTRLVERDLGPTLIPTREDMEWAMRAAAQENAHEGRS